MNKRFFPLAAFLLAPVAVSQAAETKRPNILIVINDDQSWLECSAYGNSSVQTPAFDRVAKAGVLFTRAYCSAPSCAPARAALLTGRNFWELEQGAFIQAWLPAKFATLPERLEAAGYHAGYTGKGLGARREGAHRPTRRPGGQGLEQRPHQVAARGDQQCGLRGQLHPVSRCQAAGQAVLLLGRPLRAASSARF